MYQAAYRGVVQLPMQVQGSDVSAALQCWSTAGHPPLTVMTHASWTAAVQLWLTEGSQVSCGF